MSACFSGSVLTKFWNCASVHWTSLHSRKFTVVWGVQIHVDHRFSLTSIQLPSIFMLLSQRCFCWLGHVCQMEDGHIPKDLLYWELSGGSQIQRLPQTSSKILKSASVDIQSWKASQSLGTPRELPYTVGPSKTELTACWRREPPAGPAPQTKQQQPTHASCATKTATPVLAYTATQGSALIRPDSTWCSHRLLRLKEADDNDELPGCCSDRICFKLSLVYVMSFEMSVEQQSNYGSLNVFEKYM